MSSLLDRARPRLIRPGPRLLRDAARLATRATWRALHPSMPGRYLEAPAPPPLTRLYYEAVDGWRAPVLYLPPRAGGSGEPVLVAHGLGVVGDVFRYGSGPNLAQSLSEAGFAVYLLGHRADREGLPPSEHVRPAVSFDDLVERDLPAALERVLEHADSPRLHLLGFGLGGQLAMVFAARRPAGLASVVAVGAPVRFQRARSHLRWSTRLLGLMPAHWHLPLRTAARLSAPVVDPAVLAPASPGERLRGVLEITSDDLPVALVRQIGGWLEAGTLTSRGGAVDLVEGFVDAEVPLLAVAGSNDPVGPPVSVRPAVERWGHADRSLVEVPGFGHLDLLLGEGADERVFAPVILWLEARRRLAWCSSEPLDLPLSAG